MKFHDLHAMNKLDVRLQASLQPAIMILTFYIIEAPLRIDLVMTTTWGGDFFVRIDLSDNHG